MPANNFEFRMSRRSQILISSAALAALVVLGGFLIYRLQPARPTPAENPRAEVRMPARPADTAQLPAPPP